MATADDRGEEETADPSAEVSTPSTLSEGESATPPADGTKPLEPRASGFSHPLAVIARSLSLSSLLAVAIVFWIVISFGQKWVTPFLASNDLPMPQRMTLIKTLLASLALGAVLGGVALGWAWRKGFGIQRVERWLWFLSPCLVLPFLPMFFWAKAWKGRPDVLIPLVLCVVIFAEVLLRQSLPVVPERVLFAIDWIKQKTPEMWRRHGPLIVVLGATAFYVAFMSFYNVRWHHKLKTHNFDLAIDNNLIYSALKGAHLNSTVSFGAKADQYLAAHAKLGQYVILPIYALYPKPETLIVIQGFLCGLGALPLFGFAKRHVSAWIAALIAVAYLAYVPLHSANFCESKYLSLAGFFILATFWAAEYRRWVLFGLAFVAATMMREDVPVGLAVGGAFLLVSGHRPIAGGIMALVSTVWFMILRFYIMDKAGSWWFPDMYKGLWSPGQTGFGSVIKTLLTNPLFVLNEILEKEKLLYVLHLLVPLALLPLRRWYLWASLIPGVVLTLLVTDYKPIYGPTFQYVMHWVPYLFMAAPLAIASIEKSADNGRIRALSVLGAMAIATVALSYNYGAFARRAESVKGGYFYIDFTYSPEEKHRYQELKNVITVIPDDASVVATENVGPHVSSRKLMFAMRRGVYDAEYMLAAKSELDFEQTRKLFTDSVKSRAYGVLKREGDFVVLKKGHDASGNDQLVRDWSL